jgi:hypothetical protein
MKADTKIKIKKADDHLVWFYCFQGRPTVEFPNLIRFELCKEQHQRNSRGYSVAEAPPVFSRLQPSEVLNKNDRLPAEARTGSKNKRQTHLLFLLSAWSSLQT